MDTTVSGQVDEALGNLDASRICLEMLREANVFCVSDAVEAMAAQERVIILSRALERELQEASKSLRACQQDRQH
jgi:hypothetical protein